MRRRIINMNQQIKTLQELANAAEDRRSVVYHRHQYIPQPAAFVLNMPGSKILQFINNGLFLYPKPHKNKRYGNRTITHTTTP